MGAYKLKSKSLKINNTNYYRSNGVQLGDVGDKKNSIFSVNRVDSQSNIPAPKMKVKFGETISMTSEFASDIAASASYNGLTGNMFRKQLINGELKLVRYYMDNRDIENGIESSPKLIETIKSIGKGARAVSDVFVVVQAEIYEATKGGGKFDFKSSANAEAQLDRETTIVLSPKTVLAYMLQKIDWEEKQKKNWSKIEKLIEDPKGL